ncbi:MAG: hypothetical protein M1824_001784 [Vezdaea acicularis]|nr:MAG: hypothetical protein M1824_001784 [Vezdaea acicularis]
MKASLFVSSLASVVGALALSPPIDVAQGNANTQFNQISNTQTIENHVKDSANVTINNQQTSYIVPTQVVEQFNNNQINYFYPGGPVYYAKLCDICPVIQVFYISNTYIVQACNTCPPQNVSIAITNVNINYQVANSTGVVIYKTQACPSCPLVPTTNTTMQNMTVPANPLPPAPNQNTTTTVSRLPIAPGATYSTAPFPQINVTNVAGPTGTAEVMQIGTGVPNSSPSGSPNGTAGPPGAVASANVQPGQPGQPGIPGSSTPGVPGANAPGAPGVPGTSTPGVPGAHAPGAPGVPGTSTPGASTPGTPGANAPGGVASPGSTAGAQQFTGAAAVLKCSMLLTLAMGATVFL